MRNHSNHTIGKTIRECHASSIDSRQILKRMKTLLPDKLKSIQQKYRVKHSAARSLRLSLVDVDHLNYLKELSVVYKRWIESKIKYETTLMQKQLISIQKKSPKKERINSYV